MSPEYRLRWNNHRPNLVDNFKDFLHHESLVDVTLAIGGQFIHAHKVILAACSIYFKDLFDCHRQVTHPIIILKDFNVEDVRTVVDFIYAGEVNIPHQRLPDVLKTAECLRIKGLAESPHTSLDEQAQLTQSGLLQSSTSLSEEDTQTPPLKRRRTDDAENPRVRVKEELREDEESRRESAAGITSSPPADSPAQQGHGKPRRAMLQRQTGIIVRESQGGGQSYELQQLQSAADDLSTDDVTMQPVMQVRHDSPGPSTPLQNPSGGLPSSSLLQVPSVVVGGGSQMQQSMGGVSSKMMQQLEQSTSQSQVQLMHVYVKQPSSSQANSLRPIQPKPSVSQGCILPDDSMGLSISRYSRASLSDENQSIEIHKSVCFPSSGMHSEYSGGKRDSMSHSSTPLIRLIPSSDPQPIRSSHDMSILSTPVPGLARALSEEPMVGRQKTPNPLSQSASEDLGGAVRVAPPFSGTSSSQVLGVPYTPPTSGHRLAHREGPALGCNFCWNSQDEAGRIQRRKTKYHCPECRANLCIVPCFQKYHTQMEKMETTDRQISKMLSS